MTDQTIDTGDAIRHNPTGETWVVAHVSSNKLCCCGWPEGRAELKDCTLIRKATPEKRLELLKEMANSSTGSSRRDHARHQLKSLCPEPDTKAQEKQATKKI